MILFYIIGLMLLIIGIYLWSDAYAFRAKAETIRGEIFGYRKTDYGNGNIYYPVVQYHHSGEIFVFESSVGGNSREYRIGEPVDVLVLGNNHGRARLKQGTRPALAVVIGLMGLLFVAIYFKATFNIILLGIASTLVPVAVVLLRKLNPIPGQSDTEHDVEKHHTEETRTVPNDVMEDIIRENADHDEIASKDAYIWMYAIGVITLLFSLAWLFDVGGSGFGGPLAMGLFSIFSFAMGRYLHRRKIRFEKSSAMKIYS